MKILNRKSAFTLAEVLVTLGIIGVVSSMTLPTLMKNHQRQVYVTQLHKVYNEISQAVDMYVTNNNYVSFGESRLRNNTVELNKFINSHFKVAKDCGKYYTPCFASSYSNLNGNSYGFESSYTNKCFTLSSGAAICFTVEEDMIEDESVDEYLLPVHQIGQGEILAVDVDINGQQGPNIFGRDAFSFSIDSRGNIYDGVYMANENVNFSSSNSIYSGAFGRIVNDGWRMEY